jgi:hypothetical protein
VSDISGATFAGSYFATIEIEPGNTHFCVSGNFILDFARVSIVACFGREKKIQIPDEIETISSYGFDSCRFDSVAFGSSPRLRLIGSYAFSACAGLRQIEIPSSVQEMDDGAFRTCEDLSLVEFQRKSELRRIGEKAFRWCPALRSLCLPSSVEVVGSSCFLCCKSLSTLTFELPSHLRELRSLPQRLKSLAIPDSVEVFDMLWPRYDRPMTITFGEGSKLQKIRFA